MQEARISLGEGDKCPPSPKGTLAAAQLPLDVAVAKWLLLHPRCPCSSGLGRNSTIFSVFLLQVH